MRRFASVFARKDKDARDPKPDPRRANSLVPLAPAPAPTPVPSFGSDPLSSASSAGSASLSLQTPDDDPVLARSATKSKSWTSWLGKKSGGTIKRGRPADQPSPIDQLWVEPIPDWRPTQPPPLLRAAPVPKSPPTLVVPVLDIDSDEDASSSESDEDESVSHPAAARHPPITPTPVAQSRKNLEIFIQNSLVPPLAPSPFAHLAGAPMYPRSSNPPHSLPARHSMHAAMHKTLLLRRLQRSDLSTLTVAQQQLDRSILPFASRPPPAAVDPPAPLPWFNDSALPASLMLSPSSAGLRRWMSRPCFEERIAVWVPMNGAVACQAVTGSSLAVAELEYSAALDAMIGFGLPPVEEEPSSPATPVPVPVPTPQPQPVAAPAAVRNTPFHAAPSPLRRSTLKSPPSQSSIPQIPTPTRADSLPPPPPVASSSRVRFAEDDDKDSAIPLGYALRVKKRREEKAKFLREEQERRAFEEERAKQEAERLKRELERTKWEEEKRAWEMEKRAMEEERKKRVYAEEVAAARLRREHQRLGGGHGSSASNDLLAPSSSTTFLRDERNKHSRPLHDQRRQTSESAVPQHGRAPSGSPNTSSPGSSRPPSVVGHNHSGSMGRASARPPSLHASSSEDVRQQQQSNGAKAAKRSSMASLPGRNPTFDWSSTYSAWSASNPTLQVPPMPQVPMYAMDMPLLPPTPPFMLQQYPRPRQNSHSGSSPSPSRSRLPSNASSERVNAPNGQSSSRRGSTASSSPHRPGPDQRRPSDDPRRASLPPSKPSSTRSHSNVAVSRGRPPIPSSYQAPPVPSPWTAPPLTTSYSHQQLSPAAIISGYGQRPPPQSKRRQTTIS